MSDSVNIISPVKSNSAPSMEQKNHGQYNAPPVIEQKSPEQIDVASIIAKKSPVLAKKIPNFMIRYLERTIHQDELNEILSRFSGLYDAEFATAVLGYMGISYQVYGTEKIPREGRYIFVSNHPLGGLDGLIFITEMAKHYEEIKFPVNDLLTFVDNLNGIFIGINKHGGQGRLAAKRLEDAYKGESQILYFPAGLCSRKKGGVIKDLIWQKSIITKAVQYHRDIVPVHFTGRNSNFFYNLANVRKLLRIKGNYEMLYLPDEMFKQKDKEIKMRFGKPISWEEFDNTKRPSEWAQWVKEISYTLTPEEELQTGK